MNNSVSTNPNLLENMRQLVLSSTQPLVLRGYVCNWAPCNWSIEEWKESFKDKYLTFRCMKRNYTSDEPCWERKCRARSMTFQEFIDSKDLSEWMYFDYKYLHHWFATDNEINKHIDWKMFGFPEKGAADSTFWMGSEGAHTPAHQDAYGCNVVTQLHGKKRWVMFPPEAGGLKATRVPYEESSVYSELNFYSPQNLDPFKGLSGGRVVELGAGDALVVPRGWWHYVQNTTPLAISVNMWVPHNEDTSSRVSEALVRLIVSQLCKDLPADTAKLLLNPNEDDLPDTPLSVLFLQLETVAKTYLDSRRKARRYKRQKTNEEDKTQERDDVDVGALLKDKKNVLELADDLSSEGLLELLRDNIKRYLTPSKVGEEDELDGCTSKLNLTKALIDSFCQDNVIVRVKENLLARLS